MVHAAEKTEQVEQGNEHGWHWPAAASVPSGQEDTHWVPSRSRPLGQDVQVASVPTHSLHRVALQGAQTDPLRKVPGGHWLTHVEPRRALPRLQDVHVSALSSQVAQGGVHWTQSWALPAM